MNIKVGLDDKTYGAWQLQFSQPRHSGRHRSRGDGTMSDLKRSTSIASRKNAEMEAAEQLQYLDWFEKSLEDGAAPDRFSWRSYVMILGLRGRKTDADNIIADVKKLGL